VKIVLTLEDGTRGADYFPALEAAGFSRGEVLPLGSRDAPPADFDGLLLSGGEDVDPALYGQERHARLGRVNRRRDDQELGLIAAARRRGIPIFGICRGLQVLNVAYGGTLVQDIPALKPSAVRHDVPSPKDFRAHEVATAPGSFLSPAGPSRLAVNSRHHQAIERLGSGLAACARSDDGLIEAIAAVGHAPERPSVFAVEWHPENFAGDSDAENLFRLFAEAVRRGRFSSGAR
jgi:putative glutamine amidotransferase